MHRLPSLVLGTPAAPTTACEPLHLRRFSSHPFTHVSSLQDCAFSIGTCYHLVPEADCGTDIRPRARAARSSRAALQKTRTTKIKRRAPPGLLFKSQCQQGPQSILPKRPSHRTSAATRGPYGGAALSLRSSETLLFRTRTSRVALALMVCGPCWLLLLVLQCNR